MKILSKSELEKLTTPRLLAYLGSLLKCPESNGFNDLYESYELAKNDVEWIEHHQLVKSILKNREHVK
jgi:hypothetical protein